MKNKLISVGCGFIGAFLYNHPLSVLFGLWCLGYYKILKKEKMYYWGDYIALFIIWPIIYVTSYLEIPNFRFQSPIKITKDESEGV